MENEKNIVAITATPNGPFIVEGNFKLIDREGKAEIRTGRIALCRCGKSYKPKLKARLEKVETLRFEEV